MCLDIIYLSAFVRGNYQPELLGKYPSRITINLSFIGDYLRPCLFAMMFGLELARGRITSVDPDGPSLNDGRSHRRLSHNPQAQDQLLGKSRRGSALSGIVALDERLTFDTVGKGHCQRIPKAKFSDDGFRYVVRDFRPYLFG